MSNAAARARGIGESEVYSPPRWSSSWNTRATRHHWRNRLLALWYTWRRSSADEDLVAVNLFFARGGSAHNGHLCILSFAYTEPKRYTVVRVTVTEVWLSNAFLWSIGGGEKGKKREKKRGTFLPDIYITSNAFYVYYGNNHLCKVTRCSGIMSNRGRCEKIEIRRRKKSRERWILIKRRRPFGIYIISFLRTRTHLYVGYILNIEVFGE